MAPQSPLRATALLALALSLAGCGDAVAPAFITNGSGTPTILLRAVTASDLNVCIGDVVDRILPGLGSSADLKGIMSSLGLVNSALDSRVPSQFTASTKALREAVDSYFAAQPDRAFDPDAAVLRLLSDDLVAVAAYPPLDTLRTQ
jgi:hypothetical protein